MKIIRFSLVPLVVLVAWFGGNAGQARPFTNQKGQVIEAEFESATEESVTIVRTADGRKFTIPIATLSEADQAYIAEQVEMAAKGAVGDFPEPHPDVKAGASLTLEFPQLAPDRNGNPTKVGVRIPSSYDPKVAMPLFVWMGGGQGSSSATTSGIVSGDRFITAGLPFPKGANNPNQSNMVGDFDTIWEDYHLPILTELFARIPNIDRRLCILGGFSNGAHCIAGVLQEAKDGGYPEFFNCFILVDGGNGDQRLRGGKDSFLYATWGEKSPNAARTEEAVDKASGMETGKFEMPDTGHQFADVGKTKVKEWLDEVVIPATLGKPSP